MRRVPKFRDEMHELTWRLAFDIAWICERFIKITVKDGNKLEPFVLNRVQRWVVWNIYDMEDRGLPVRLWILKGRQFGISTLFAVIMYIRAAVHGRNALMLSHKEKPGKNMFAKVERAHRNLTRVAADGKPVQIVHEPTNFSTGDEMRWSIPPRGKEPAFEGLVKRESAENEDAGVSETYQDAHLTEPPLWKATKHTMDGFMPTVSSDPSSMITGEFTARVAAGYTYETWTGGEAGENAFRTLFLPWYWHEEYTRNRQPDDKPFTPTERRLRDKIAATGYEYPLTESGNLKAHFARINKYRQIRNADLVRGFKITDEQLLWWRHELRKFKGDIDIMKREYPEDPAVAWQSGGRRVIPPSVMDQLDTAVANTVELDRGEYEAHRGHRGKAVVKYRKREDGRVWRWKPPEPGATYVIDADPSSGVGADSSGAHVLKVTFKCVEVVASFRAKVQPHEFARILARMGRHYRTDAVFDAEAQRLVGGRPALIVPERNGFGEHVIYELTQTLRYKRVWRWTDRTRDDWRHGHDYGFPVTKATKMPMLQHLVKLCYDDELKVPCSRTRRELRGLIYLDDFDEQAGAAPGGHDDMAMSFGEGCWAAAQLSVFKRPPASGMLQTSQVA